MINKDAMKTPWFLLLAANAVVSCMITAFNEIRTASYSQWWFGSATVADGQGADELEATDADDESANSSAEEVASQLAIAKAALNGGNGKTAIEIYEPLARQGVMEAQFRMAVIFFEGRVRERDYEKAYFWARKAVDSGAVGGLILWAQMCESGRGMPVDLKKAFELNLLAANKGSNTVGAYQVGKCYAEGRGTEKNPELGVKWYRTAADTGYAEAQSALAAMYESGEGVKQDFDEAESWYRKAAEKNDAFGQFGLGRMYDKGKGVTQDSVKAIEWYTKAARQGLVVAQCALGDLYRNGANRVPVDLKKAEEWYRQAASKESVDGELGLGILFCMERHQDFAEARAWLLKAANRGNAEAQSRLGDLYFFGQGVPQDPGKAAEWYLKAMDRLAPRSMPRLAEMYREGKGVERDVAQVDEWMRRSKEHGISVPVTEPSKPTVSIAKPSSEKKDTEPPPKVTPSPIPSPKPSSPTASSPTASPAPAETPMSDESPDEIVAILNAAKEALDQGNAQEALVIYEALASDGNPDAPYYAAMIYMEGRGVAVDFKKAIRYAEQAAEKGSIEGQLLLAQMFREGKGTAVDHKRAFSLYARISQNNATPAADKGLGDCYSEGAGVEKDTVKAIELYQKAYAGGIARAASRIGELFENGSGVEKDLKAAESWYRKAAEKEDALGQFSLGRMYEMGTGVDADPLQAVEWYGKAAQSGLFVAQCALGDIYRFGAEGFPADPTQAIEWYRKAASRGYARAQYSLSLILSASGDLQHKAEARQLLEAAAKQGHLEAKAALRRSSLQ